MNSFLDRSIKLLGEERIASFKDKVILIAGLGGVGGTAFEALLRSGFEKYIIIDFDNVDISNLNRQILFNLDDVNKNKVEIAKKHALKINPNVQIETLEEKIDSSSFDEFEKHVDYVIDAIDYIPGKIALAKLSSKLNAHFISSLGMGNRLNPEQVFITKLNKTENDPLAKKFRYECKINGLDLSKINVVFSKETPIIKDKKPASMMMVPSTAGLLIARFVIEKIMEE